MDFIDRKKELGLLGSVSKLPNGGVAVVYGRRRVGKTRLLLEWSNKHKGVYYMADESAAPLQRKYLSLALEQALPGFSLVDYPDWTALFIRLAKDALQANWRGPLVIDELPYLITASPELPSILQKFLDIEAKKAKLVIALCGSSQRMMQGAVLEASAPLYGRADQIIKLSPLLAGYISEALECKSAKEEIEAYAIWGGIPKYWELAQNSGLSLLPCIEQLVLDPMGPLNDEPQRLLQLEIPSAASLRPLLDSIGLGAHRASEIAMRTGQPVTSLARPLQRLLELDFVHREIPYGAHEYDSKRALYKIKDPFLKFWFELFAAHRSYLAQVSRVPRQKWLKKPLQPFFADAWEELCRQATPQLSALLWGPPYFGNACRYWQKQGPEWDLLANSIEGDAILIGEAKWSSKAPTERWIQTALDELKTKGLPPTKRPEQAQCYYALFVPEKPRKLTLPPKTRVVDAEEVLQALR